MTAPSRQTAGRRRRAQLALERALDAQLGPDGAEVVYTFPDGWTIRRLTRLEDQLREGEVMHNCLRALRGSTDPNCLSLRDADNLPHATFATWTIGASDDLSEIPDSIANICFLRTSRALMIVDPHPLKAAHVERLREFGSSDAVVDCPPFPRDTKARTEEAARAIDPGYVVHSVQGGAIHFPPSFASARDLVLNWLEAEPS